MKIFVLAKPNAYEDKIEEIDSTHFKVEVTELPQNGKANFAIQKILAKHLNIPRSQVQLVKGYSAKNKVFEDKFKNLMHHFE